MLLFSRVLRGYAPTLSSRILRLPQLAQRARNSLARIWNERRPLDAF